MTRSSLATATAIGEGLPAGSPRRREALVDAVFRCVVDYGLEDTTTSVIAAEAGVSRGVIHYYFKDKLALFEAAFERVLDGFEESLRRHPIDPTLPPAEQLRALVRLGLPVTETSRERTTFWVQFMAARTREPALRELNGRHVARWLAFLRERLEAMRAGGALPPGADTTAMATAILAFSDGLGLLMAGEIPIPEATVESALTLFVDRLAAAESPRVVPLPPGGLAGTGDEGRGASQ
jgi:AcrR family transcriptional regulator